MGILSAILYPIEDIVSGSSTKFLICLFVIAFLCLSVVFNVLRQALHKNPHEPPVVFHWVPFIGSTVAYGIDPYKFFFKNLKKYGDAFTFILLGKKVTVVLGTKGNDFILNGKLKDLNAEEVYGPLTTPVFGKDVVYDCPNAKLMEQKKFVKFGLTTEALQSHVRLIIEEVQDYIKRSPVLQGSRGTFDVPQVMAEITLFTASRSLQGKEVREKFDSTFADLYHDLDMGFTPINFMLPWAPLPQNRRRDAAHRKMVQTYTDIIKTRRTKGDKGDEQDMIWNLMSSSYKDGRPVPDKEIAHMMIALLMAGQHSSSSTSSWIVLRLASEPELIDELYHEQLEVLGSDLPLITFADLQRLPLHSNVVKETLRINAPIHSIMRQVKQPMPLEGTPYVIPTSHVLLAAPGVTALSNEHFPNPMRWDPHRWDTGSANSASNRRNNNSSSANASSNDSGKVGGAEKADEEEKVDFGYGLVSKGTGSPYLPFGAGRHRCIGEQFAYVQLGAILATLVREFRFRNVDGKEGVVGTDYSSLFSQPMRPAVVQWERREKRGEGGAEES